MSTLNRPYLFDVRPLHRETLASYTSRLLAANFETAHHQRHLTREVNPSGRNADRETAWLDVLRRKTSRDNFHFTANRSAWMTHDDGTSCDACSAGLQERVMCKLCAHGATVEQHPHFDDIVCAKHGRWVGLSDNVDDQHAATPAVIASGRQFRQLRRQHRLDVRFFTMLSDALNDQATDGTSETLAVNSRTFPKAVALATLLTSVHFSRQFFNPEKTFAASHEVLRDAVRSVVDERSPELVRAIWLYARPTVWAIRDSIIVGGEHTKAWAHDLYVPASVASSFSRSARPAEPFANYLAITGDDQLSASRHGVKPHHKAATRTMGTATTKKRVLTICAAGHQFPAATLTASDIKNGKAPNCPLCRHRMIVPGYNDLATTHPNLALEFDLELNDGLEPTNIAPSSLRKYFWRCRSGHSYQATAGNRASSKSGCPLCLGRLIVPGINDLSTTHPELIGDWHPAWLSHMTPLNITAGSNAFVTWLCPAGHRYEMRVWERTAGKGCGKCRRADTHASGINLAVSHPQLSAQWHPTFNGDAQASGYTAGSKAKVYWQCSTGHHFQQRIERRVAGYGCSVCSRRTLVPNVNDLATTYPELVTEWHPYMNLKSPHEIFPGTDRHWWKCIANGHKYKQSVPDRLISRGCPECSREERLLN